MNDLLEKPNLETKAETSTSLRNIGRSVIRALRLFEAASVLKSRQTEVRGGQQVEAAQQIPRTAIEFSEDTGRHHIKSGENRKTVDEIQWQQQFDPSEIAELEKKNAHYRMALKDPNMMVAPDEIYGTASFTPPIPGNKMPSDNDLEKAFKAIPPADYQIPQHHTHNTN